jgi:hypothetical protein
MGSRHISGGQESVFLLFVPSFLLHLKIVAFDGIFDSILLPGLVLTPDSGLLPTTTLVLTDVRSVRMTLHRGQR